MTRLRHVVAFALLAVCFAVVGLWWRSYVAYDMVQGSAFAQTGFLGSFEGVVAVELVEVLSPSFLVPWGIHSSSADEIKRRIEQGPSTYDDDAAVLGFWARARPHDWLLQVPHWFLALLTLAAAFSVRPAPRFRFSSRELLAGVTLAGIACGIVAMMPRG